MPYLVSYAIIIGLNLSKEDRVKQIISYKIITLIKYIRLILKRHSKGIHTLL